MHLRASSPYNIRGAMSSYRYCYCRTVMPAFLQRRVLPLKPAPALLPGIKAHNGRLTLSSVAKSKCHTTGRLAWSDTTPWQGRYRKHTHRASTDQGLPISRAAGRNPHQTVVRNVVLERRAPCTFVVHIPNLTTFAVKSHITSVPTSTSRPCSDALADRRGSPRSGSDPQLGVRWVNLPTFFLRIPPMNPRLRNGSFSALAAVGSPR